MKDVWDIHIDRYGHNNDSMCQILSLASRRGIPSPTTLGIFRLVWDSSDLRMRILLLGSALSRFAIDMTDNTKDEEICYRICRGVEEAVDYLTDLMRKQGMMSSPQSMCLSEGKAGLDGHRK